MTLTTLTDAQCEEFRRTPGSFNDMVRAIYEAGQARAALSQPQGEPVAFITDET